MKNDLLAISLELKSVRESDSPQLDDHAVLATLSGLSVVFEEVFLWSCHGHITVWVVGNNMQLLVKAFDHFKKHFVKMEVLTKTQAHDCFKNIVSGETWKEVSAVEKLVQLNKGYEIATSLHSVGVVLQPIIVEGIAALSNDPIVVGSRHSWSKHTGVFQTGIVRVQSTDIFFRFSVN